LTRALLPYLEALAVTALVAAGGIAIAERVELPNISLIFVIPVLAAAVRHGLFASLWAAALAVLAYDYFFLPPLYRFTIADPADVLALLFFLLVALVTSALAAGPTPRPARRSARRAPPRSSTISAERSPAWSISTTCFGSWSPTWRAR
jgi:two-component system sensor histidine kinase KdpD